MEIRLLLNQQPAALPADIRKTLRLSKTGTDASSLDSRSAEVSYTLELPFCRANDLIFGRGRDVQTVDKFNPAAPYRAQLYVAGRLFFAGVWQLTGIKGAYVGKLVSEEVDVFAAIGSKTLQELKFAPFAYQGQHGFVERLSKSPADTDLVFPLVAYGNYFAPPLKEVDPATGEPVEVDVPASNKITRPLEIDEVLPSVSFVRTLRQIFADVGWQVAGEPVVDAASWCMPFTGDEYKWNWGELLKLRATQGAQTYNSNSNTVVVPLPPANLAEHYWLLAPGATYNPARRYRPDEVLSIVPGVRANVYQVRREGGYMATASVTITAATPPSGRAWLPRLQIVKLEQGQELSEAEAVAELALVPQGFAVPAPGTYTLTTAAPVYLENTHRLLAVLNTRAQPGSVFTLATAAVTWSVTPVVEEIGPEAIDVAANLPAFTQKEFVKGFCTLANLRFVADPATKLVSFYYRERYELPPALALDLSTLGDPEACEYAPALTAKRVVLAWQPDNGDALLRPVGYAKKDGSVAPKAGEGQYDAVFVNGAGRDDEQVLALPWAPTVRRVFALGDYGLSIPCLASEEQLKTKLNEVSWEYGYVPRLLRYRGISTPDAVRPDFAFLSSEEQRYGRADFGGFSFAGAAGRYELYWRAALESLQRGHLLSGEFALTPALYAALTPASAVLFAGGLYRLGKISSFTVGDATTTVEMVREVASAVGGGVAGQVATPTRVREHETPEWDYQEYY